MNITDITASAYTVPTDLPEGDGTLTWNSTTLVLVEASSEGTTGFGWTYAGPAAACIVGDVLARVAVGASAMDIPYVHEAMCRAVRNLAQPGVCSMAISAVDCALWDLKARLLGLPLDQLLGQATGKVPVYGSGGFTTYDDDALHRQLKHWVGQQGIPRVKIKIGESWGNEEGRDLRRLRQARATIGEGAELYADANGGYSVKQAIRVAKAAEELDLRWLEEPVSSDDLTGLRQVADAVQAEVAAGEYGLDLPYFARMLPAVDCLQIDVTRCGGITEFLRAAGLARAAGRQVSAHCAPSQHAAVMSSIPNARHIEWFHDHSRIESMFFDGALDPTGGAIQPRDDTPGNGLTIKHTDLDTFRIA